MVIFPSIGEVFHFDVKNHEGELTKVKKFWVKVLPWRKEMVTCALESGADAVLVPDGYYKRVKELGVIDVVAKDGDIKLGEDAIELEVKGKEDEEEALRLSRHKTLILKMRDWTIIPLENLVSQTEGLIVVVRSAEEARTAIQILERGVDGVLLETGDMNEVSLTGDVIKRRDEDLHLKAAKVTKIKPLGMGDRVCVDTCTNMGLGEGILVGNTSDCFFLVHSESVENPYVEPRPFRVNASGVHAYTLVPGGRTRYLSELRAGDEVLIVDKSGRTQVAVVGRCKVERRPLMLVEAEYEGRSYHLILQNAETIRLTDPSGEPVSVVELKEGSEVLVWLGEAGRHFGVKISETIVEK
jgi:3-dehydroquinate synthase II